MHGKKNTVIYRETGKIYKNTVIYIFGHTAQLYHKYAYISQKCYKCLDFSLNRC